MHQWGIGRSRAWRLLLPAHWRRAAVGPAVAVAVAVAEFATGPVLDNPQRVGTALQRQFEGYWSARRGDYRIVYRIGETTVFVVRVDHRGTVYRR